MPITESSVTLNFPDNNYFRLCDCDGYKAIQNNFAEMDVCWYDQKEVSVYPNTFFINSESFLLNLSDFFAQN